MREGNASEPILADIPDGEGVGRAPVDHASNNFQLA